jgi:hypothetical protein
MKRVLKDICVNVMSGIRKIVYVNHKLIFSSLPIFLLYYIFLYIFLFPKVSSIVKLAILS